MANYGSIEDTAVAPTSAYLNWTPEQVSEELTKVGLGGYLEVLQQNKITGRVAVDLTESDIKDMGVTIVGDRIRMRQALQGIARKARVDALKRGLWQGHEQLYFSGVEQCFFTCCGCCPDDPSTYKLTTNYIRVRLVEPARIGPITLCCCNHTSTNNIDLTQVEDVDVNGVPAPTCLRIFCCAPGKDIIEILSSAEKERVQLIVRGGEGEHVSQLIMNQVEETQAMERE